GCPHQCVFCNQSSITGVQRKIPSPDALRQIIQTNLTYNRKKRNAVQIAFFGGNFLGVNPADIKLLLTESATFVDQGLVGGIRFSTRPDTLDKRRLDMIRNFPVATVELGAQSMNDYVLRLSRRGHTAADTVKAVTLLKQRDYEIGLQIMVGLPGDDQDRVMATGRRIAALNPDFVRIYPTVVLDGSLLASWYQNGTYKPLSLDDAVNQVKTLYLFFKKKNIRVIRMGLQTSGDLEQGTAVIAGPYHPAFGHLVYSAVFLDKVLEAIESAKLFTDSISIGINPNNISKLRGIQNRNIKILKEKFGFKSIEVRADYSLKEDQLNVSSHL
ncbi:MAG: radical SAM protein, partial [Desulfobacterales bacterium]